MHGVQPLETHWQGTTIRRLPATVAPADRNHNLPAQLSSFVGRQGAIADARRLLSTARLLTLSGPGGIGKTRLALAVAEMALPDYSDGVWLVELGALAAPTFVTRAIAAVFGLRDEAQPLIQTLTELLRDRRLLLVLDNCEHLLTACARVADVLLRASAELHIVATSREPLGLVGETVYRVPGLSVPESGATPSAANLQHAEAVQLFVERARAIALEFALTERNAAAVAEVCRELDGIPLAIELAAAASKVLTPDQIAGRLGDRFQLLVDGNRIGPRRQQTLRATLDWSYRLLLEPERRLFERLSIFAGGWTLDAAEAVCSGTDIEPQDVLYLLARLVDTSLVLAEPMSDGIKRYRYLETVRQYAYGRLIENGDLAPTQQRHATFCVTLAERAEVLLARPGLDGSLHLLERELELVESDHNNIRAALGGLIERGEVDNAARLGGAICHFWLNRGYLEEGRAWLEQLLARTGGAPNRMRIKLLHGAALLSARLTDLAAGQQFSHQSLRLARALGDVTSVSYSLYLLGLVAYLRGEYRKACAVHQQGINADRTATKPADGEPGTYPAEYHDYFEVLNLAGLGDAAYSQGDDDRAEAAAEETIARATKAGYVVCTAWALMTLGLIRYRRGDSAAATSFLEESLSQCRAIGEQFRTIGALRLLGCLARERGDVSRARALLGESLEMAHGLAKTGGDRLLVARSLEAFAVLAAAWGKAEDAVRLEAVALDLYRRIASPPHPSPLIGRERWLKPAHEALGPERAAAAQAEGRALSLDQAIAQALKLEVADRSGATLSAPAGAATVGIPLTAREREIADPIAQGLSNRQIAEQLVIAVSTAERHVANILAKLGFARRTQVAVWAAQYSAKLEPGRS